MPTSRFFKRHLRKLVWPGALLMLAVASSAYAQEGGWRNQHGQAVADSAAMKSAGGFSASLLVTPDPDWQEKWNTPADTSPHFTTAEVVRYGEKVTVLIFFANPKADAQGKMKVRCDIKITRPNGAVSFEQTGLPCFEGALAGNPTHIHLARPAVVFSGDPDDQPGKWVVDVAIRDENRPVGMHLQTSFELSK